MAPYLTLMTEEAPQREYPLREVFNALRYVVRAGIEGRISGLKRRHRLVRCRYHGEDGMERWVG